MTEKEKRCQSRKGKSINVKILYSRAGVAQHIWINNENGSILFDTGDGVLRDILTNNLDISQIKGLVFTHGHFDHVGGLHSLLGFLRMIERKEPLTIFAPKGCKEAFSIADNFVQCYSKTIPFRISKNELQSDEVFQIAGMTIMAYPVIHCGTTKGSGILKQIPAMGYRISYKGETIAISGDTGICSSLKELVKGVDLAILEATFQTSAGISREMLEKVHLSENLAKEVGKLAKDFILIHKGKRKSDKRQET
jgi:ribonuclease Z